MDKRAYMSGSQKRKLKQERDNSIKKLAKLDKFLIKTQSGDVETSSNKQESSSVSVSEEAKSSQNVTSGEIQLDSAE